MNRPLKGLAKVRTVCTADRLLHRMKKKLELYIHAWTPNYLNIDSSICCEQLNKVKALLVLVKTDVTFTCSKSYGKYDLHI